MHLENRRKCTNIYVGTILIRIGMDCAIKWLFDYSSTEGSCMVAKDFMQL